MPRNISFALTTPQFRARTKTVTRRLGWKFLQPGDVLCGKDVDFYLLGLAWPLIALLALMED